MPGTERDGYEVVVGVPHEAEYRRVREAAGLSAKSREAALAGLPNSLFGVMVTHGGALVGMGRVVGDGGLFYFVVDIAVLPEHQGRGLGKRIVGRIVEEIRAMAQSGAHVTLIADGDARHLYAQFGFRPTAPEAIGMSFTID